MNLLVQQAANRETAIAWARTKALPLWYDHGWDSLKGGFVESLDEAGQPERTRVRRVRVQARQIYVFAHAAILGWHEGATDRALEGFDWLLANCRSGGNGPGFVHKIDADGAVRDSRVDAYDQAFCLLAMAWIYRLTKDSGVESLISRELEFLDDNIADRKSGGWREDVLGSLPMRQNPQMHAFEAMLALFEATGERSYLDRAQHFSSLLFSKLRHPDTGAILEYYGPDFSRLGGEKGDCVEPGHHFEWCWLLLKYAALQKLSPDPIASSLFAWAIDYGLDSSGFVVDQVSSRGAVLKSTRRLWPQTEFIKANLAMSRNGLDADAGGRVDAAWDRLFGSYLSVEPRGGWVDCFSEAGRLLDGSMPASSFYHIFSAISESVAAS